MFNTPILFLVFNRPDTTKQVFEAIKNQKPGYLYIAADGPRSNHPDDAEKCKQTRDLVTNGIDWDCEVRTLFRNENLGCGRAVSSAITWFFENVEEGIILEDDCLPNNSFFTFCETLLEYYRDNDNIYVISGNNFQKKRRGKASYYFSAYGHIWGWATWRRAWAKYTFSLQGINNDDFKDCLNNYFNTKSEREYWFNIFLKMKNDPIDTWDYQWTICQWINGGLNILPNKNLVTNIGFGESATHTKISSEKMIISSFEIKKIIFNYRIKIHKKADLYTFINIFHFRQSLLNFYKSKLYQIINNIIKTNEN